MAELSSFDQRRLAVYLAGLQPSGPGQDQAIPAGDAQVPDQVHTAVFICGASESRGHIYRRHADRHDWRAFRGARYKNYIREAQLLVRDTDPRAVFAVYAGDCRSRLTRPTILKSRMIRDRDAAGVLLPLDRDRHWGDIALVDRTDRDFALKADTLVWRGGTTGLFRSYGPDLPHSSRFHVASLPEDRPGLNIGYSEIVQIDDETTDLPMERIRARLLPPLSVAEQLGSKYLLSLEGNDVASGLKWMLYSNSAVVMPPPTCESWACEGELVPFQHYIPVRHDLSDLDEVFDWCLSHPAEGADIARNGRLFIEPFLDREKERALCGQVIATYLDQSDLHLSYGPVERLAQALRIGLGSLAARH